MLKNGRLRHLLANPSTPSTFQISIPAMGLEQWEHSAFLAIHLSAHPLHITRCLQGKKATNGSISRHIVHSLSSRSSRRSLAAFFEGAAAGGMAG
mmetsp:Transcript_1704/g.4282  ORF Transcript_1704/g.4282 Transcript_1704/m.4282 type:complete len:95 (+) Transcript_1704:162-446(+)